jgi:parallel beta-helix repeat protein
VFNITNSKNITLKGFTITGGFDGVFLQSIRGLTIDPTDISHNAHDGMSFTGGCDDVVIEDSQISHNGMDGIDLDCTGKNVTIRNNDISNNGETNARRVGIRLSGGIDNVTIEGNHCNDNAFACVHPQ